MPENKDSFLEKLNRIRKDQHNLWRIVTSLSIVVIVAVFWSLKLTGIGIAGEAFCGKTEHVHEEGCLQKTLICTLEEGQAHVHGESCLNRELICQLEESEEHSHTEECWSVEQACGIEASEGHTHEEACYEIVELCQIEEHIHIESCYSDITADLETSDDWEMTLADMVRGPTTSVKHF